MSYFTPDLSGSLENYRVTNDVFRLFQQNQKIQFKDSPVFLDTLNMTLQSDSNAVLVNGTDWEAQADDIDYTEMSRAKQSDPAFNRTLVNSITIIRSFTGGDISVKLDYQKLYPVVHKSSFGLDSSIDLTPDLLVDMLGRMGNLETLLSSTGSNLVVPSPVATRTLDFDQHGTNTNNLIEDEVHNVNTFTNFNLISPAQGAFFKDSVIVKLSDTDEVLEEGTDYIVVGVNAAHTKETLNPSGVNNLIQITRPIAADLKVTYHAVGGSVTSADMKMVSDEVNNISEYLGTRAFLTPQSLSASAPYQSILNRITTLETKMRVLATTGQPDYGDSTNGVTTVKQLQAVDIQQHWWNVAELYKVDGSEDIFVSDRTRFRMKFAGSKIMADVIVAVDLTQTRNPFSLTVTNVIQDVGYSLHEAGAVADVIMPKFRIIWNDDGGSPLSGIVLQVGLHLPGLTDTLVIEDYSGLQSAWKTIPYGGSAESPSDDSVLLPDGVSIWSSLSPASSFVHSKMMPSMKPYRAWEGAVALDSLDLATDLSHLLPNYFDVVDVKAVHLVMTDTVNTRSYSVRVPMLKTAPASTAMYGQAGISAASGVVTTDLGVNLVDTAGTITLNVGPVSGAIPASLTNHDLVYVLVEV